VVVLIHEGNYSKIKNFFNSFGIRTQCVRLQNAQKGNLTVASNILRMMNTKMGENNYSLEIP
jgi:16S rRNA U516 pseudouridylate synthase RsuA-like enzyme